MMEWLLDRQVRLRRALETLGGVPPVAGGPDLVAGVGEPRNERIRPDAE
jgi:hypothetical protein